MCEVGMSADARAFFDSQGAVRAAYLSGVRAGLEAAAEKAGETKHPPGTVFEEGYDCGRADAEAAIRALSAESIAKEAADAVR